MEYKVEINSLENFKAWSGGLETLNTVRERGGVDTLTVICEDIFSGDMILILSTKLWAMMIF